MERDRSTLGDPASGIRAVLFDFGGVIAESPFPSFAAYERNAGLEEGFLRRLNSADPNDNAWARLERGEICRAEFVSAFEKEALLLGGKLTGEEILSVVRRSVRPKMVEAVRRIRLRFLVGLLTNNFLSSEPREPEVEEVIGLFDEVVESSIIGHRKPEPGFYEVACQKLQIAPEEAVFLDDLGMNLKTARAMGMRTIKVLDVKEALDELSELVGMELS